MHNYTIHQLPGLRRLQGQAGCHTQTPPVEAGVHVHGHHARQGPQAAAEIARLRGAMDDVDHGKHLQTGAPSAKAGANRGMARGDAICPPQLAQHMQAAQHGQDFGPGMFLHGRGQGGGHMLVPADFTAVQRPRQVDGDHPGPPAGAEVLQHLEQMAVGRTVDGIGYLDRRQAHAGVQESVQVRLLITGYFQGQVGDARIAQQGTEVGRQVQDGRLPMGRTHQYDVMSSQLA